MLQTTFMNLNLKNPIIVAAGPWSSNAATIQRAIDQGAGAVITETITSNPSVKATPSVYYSNGAIMSATLYGGHSLEDWENEFEQIDKKDAKLICCIRGGSTSEIAYLSKKVERLGADAIQLDFFAPVGPTISRIGQNPNILLRFVQAACDAVSIPVMLRLPHYMAEQVQFIHQLEATGLKAVTLIESIRAIQGVDIERGKVRIPTYLGYTGDHVRPITLAAIATFSQMSDLEISATSGIVNAHHVLECLMLGATTVQLGSTILLNGYDIIGQTLSELENWCQSKEIEQIGQIRSQAIASIQTDGPGRPRHYQVELTQACAEFDCDICSISCLSGALQQTEAGLVLDNQKCQVCGLCVSRCPEHLIRLVERKDDK